MAYTRAHDLEWTLQTHHGHTAHLLHTLETTDFLGYDKGPAVYVWDLVPSDAGDLSDALCDLAQVVLVDLIELYQDGYDYEGVFYAADGPEIDRLTQESLSAVVRLVGTVQTRDFYWIPFDRIQAAVVSIQRRHSN